MHTPTRFIPATTAAVLCALLPCLLLSAAPARATNLLRVLPADHAEYQRLLRLAPEARDEGAVTRGRAVEFPAATGRAEELRSQGFTVEVALADLESFYASRLTRDNNFGAYHTYDEAIQAMDALAAAHPDIMTPRFSIGTTLQGRALWVYKISDNPNVDEDEPEVFFNAYIHAREPITFEIVYDLAQVLVNGYGSDPRATDIVNNREVFILPVINPDGVEYNHQTNPSGGGMWRKNRRDNGDGSYGVDLNRNFGYQWGYDNEGSSPYGWDETYRGPSAFSEEETSAIRDFCIARHFTIAINNHSYGNYNLMAFEYDNLHCPDHEVHFALGRLRKETSGYATGTTWEMLYLSNGDANDWMYGEQQAKPPIFSLVTESGSSSDGFWPPESRIPALVAENREGNLRMCELADNPERILPPGLAQSASPDSVPPNFTLTWSVPQPDPDNPAVAWNLIEATGLTTGADDLEGTHQERWAAEGWSFSAARSHSPTHSAYSGEADHLNALLLSRRSHGVQPGEQLKFWTWYRIENGWDYGYVEISTDARTFTPLQGSITTNSDPNGRNLGNGITGSSSSWVQAVFDLGAYAGQTVWLRFRYNTDAYVTEEGWYVDDIEPSELFATETLLAEGLATPQYSFVSHPLGTFHYLIQSVDGEGDTAVWSPPKRLVFTETSSVGPGRDENRAWSGLQSSGANPFNGTVRLSFTLPPGCEEWSLRIVDVAGRVVASEPGSSGEGGASAGTRVQYDWSPVGLPSGVYLAWLRAGNLVSQQRLIYIR